MVASIIICIVIVIVIGLIIFIVVKDKKDRKNVEETSLVVKKINELNSKFPKIDPNYKHDFVERVNFQTRKSAVNFNPTPTFTKNKAELKRIASIRINNSNLYNEYKRLFNETLNNVKTDESIINSANLKVKTYRKIENEIVKALFKRVNDNKEITFQVYSHYVSPQGRSTYNSRIYTYAEKDFSSDVIPKKINIDYLPYIENRKEEKPKIVEVERKEEIIKEEKIEVKEINQELKEEIKEVKPVTDIEINDVNYHLENNIAKIKNINKNSKNINIPTFIQANGMKYYIKSINNNIFTNNKNIETISIEDGIEEIKDSAFKNCSSLTSVTLPSTLKVINKKTFSGCVKLKEIRISSSVESIEEEAFSLCSNLSDVYIPSSVKYIGPSVFWYSTKVKIHIQSGCDISHFDADWNVDNNEVIFEAFN